MQRVRVAPKYADDAELGRRFARHMTAWLIESGRLRREVADSMEKSPSLVTGWAKGRNFPSIRQIRDLAREFKLPRQRLKAMFADLFDLR